jgi:2',3'-cyclic-nucleotide 2'-phosphodiesterase (5'-nucleotidase family)
VQQWRRPPRHWRSGPSAGIARQLRPRWRTDDASAGRLVADAQWVGHARAAARGGAQFAFMNPGGVRTDPALRRRRRPLQREATPRSSPCSPSATRWW